MRPNVCNACGAADGWRRHASARRRPGRPTRIHPPAPPRQPTPRTHLPAPATSRAASLNIGEQARILAFKHKAPAPPEGYQAGLAGLYNSNVGAAPARKHFRHVPQTQERILDAPDLVDDYYLNLLDWSGNNVVRVWRAASLPARFSAAACFLAAAEGCV